MNRTLRISLALLVFLLSFALMGSKPYDGKHDKDEIELQAKLKGSNEAPVLGDPDGKGNAKITLKQEGYQVCWNIKVKKILLPASAAHIHRAPAGAPGPVVVPLSAPDAKGKAKGCIAIAPDLFMNISMNPEQYYVNVHNSVYPGGAARGQLAADD
jgi:hypothetical protein